MRPDLYAAEMTPRLLAASAELLLDALPDVEAGARWLEVDAGAGALTQALAPRVQAGGAQLVACDARLPLLGSLAAPGGHVRRVAARLSALPLERGCHDVVLGSLVLGSRAEDRARASALAGALKPGGTLVATAVLEGSFEELLDLLIESCEGLALHRARASFIDARDDLPSLGETRDALAAAGLVVDAAGVEERALFFEDAHALSRSAFVQDVLLGGWLPDGPALPSEVWRELVRAREAYFGAGQVSVRLRTALLRARAPADVRAEG